MLQLFIPLGVLGMVYRQIKYTLADMDTVFRLLEQPPEINDSPAATELVIGKGEIQFENVDLPTTLSARFCEMFPLACPLVPRWQWLGIVARGSPRFRV